jgi:hypothetical protein
MLAHRLASVRTASLIRIGGVVLPPALGTDLKRRRRIRQRPLAAAGARERRLRLHQAIVPHGDTPQCCIRLTAGAPQRLAGTAPRASMRQRDYAWLGGVAVLPVIVRLSTEQRSAAGAADSLLPSHSDTERGRDRPAVELRSSAATVRRASACARISRDASATTSGAGLRRPVARWQPAPARKALVAGVDNPGRDRRGSTRSLQTIRPPGLPGRSGPATLRRARWYVRAASPRQRCPCPS